MSFSSSSKMTRGKVAVCVAFDIPAARYARSWIDFGCKRRGSNDAYFELSDTLKDFSFFPRMGNYFISLGIIDANETAIEDVKLNISIPDCGENAIPIIPGNEVCRE